MAILVPVGFSFLALVLCLNLIQSTKGFSIDLIHRDSHKSPLHNPSTSHFLRLNKAFGRSLSRASYLKHAYSSRRSKYSMESQVAFQGGEYIMNISIGTPPVVMIGIVDTGSDVTWTQCSPCPHCYKQNIPFFNPRNTSTYKQLSCHSSQCKSLDSVGCDHRGKCKYDFTYGDGSYSDGDLATETFTFQSSSNSTGGAITIPEVVFGCTHGTGGGYNESASGIVGLGGGSLSIVNQLSDYTERKFSFCLVPFGSNLTGKFYLGNDVVLSGSKLLSTPLFMKSPHTYYNINLEGISVGNTTYSYSNTKHLNSKDSKDIKVGNFIIDSGTTVTILPTKLYHDLESTLISSISGNRTSDPENIFTLCYEKEGDIDINHVFPDMVFHFTDADLELPPANSFVEVVDGVMCLAMFPSDDVHILGNISMMNFLVEIDLENKKVNFLPTDCSKEK